MEEAKAQRQALQVCPMADGLKNHMAVRNCLLCYNRNKELSRREI